MKKSTLTFTIIGAGNGGLAFAAHLAIKGFKVNLYNRSSERIMLLKSSLTLQLVANRDTDEIPHGKGHLNKVTTDIKEALEGADIIMVVVPATGHADIAEVCAPHLKSGQIIILHPGRTGGALEFRHILLTKGAPNDIIVSEAQTLLYACRASNPGQVQIFGIKNSVPISAIPAYKTPEVIKKLSIAFDEFVPGDNVMKTSLDNIGAVFHPAVMILNCGRIESSRGDFEFYIDGISRSVARILEKVDKERVSVGAALGFNCMSAREWLYIAYGAAGKTLYDAIRANQGYYGIKAPPIIAHRYITEDVPMSLVPIASLGDLMGAPCPTIKNIIQLANIALETDFYKIGRTTSKMGLDTLNLQQLRQVIIEGEIINNVKSGGK